MMKTWNYIKLEEYIGARVTDEGNDILDLSVYGWNDDEDKLDCECLATITLLIDDTYIEYGDVTFDIEIEHHYEEVDSNVTVIRLEREAVEMLKNEAVYCVENYYL